MTELERLAAALAAAARGGGVPVLATLVSVEGSAYRKPGARMVIASDGTTAGAVSGGCLEKDLVARAEEVRRTGDVQVAEFDLTADDDKPWGLGMGCAAKLRVVLEPCPGGLPDWLRESLDRQHRDEPYSCGVIVTRLGTRYVYLDDHDERGESKTDGVFLEDPMFPPPRVFACGDGPDARVLAGLARHIGWRAKQVRKAQHLPGYQTLLDAVVVMSHNYARDLALMEQVFRAHQGAIYLGVLGPRARTERLLADLAARGLPINDEGRERLHAPAGLDIGAETPEEIALAIIAEIRAAISKRGGGFLRERDGPIHDRP